MKLSNERSRKLHRAEEILLKNGISPDEAASVLQEIGLALTDRDIYSTVLDDRQAICSAVRDALLLTSNGGMPSCNPLKELRYIPETEHVRPIFEDGTGESGYYDINVSGDSGSSVIVDIAIQFIRKMW